MSDIRSELSLLDEHEIEAIKINQAIIKRMADNSQRIKNYFLIFSGLIITIVSSMNNTDFNNIFVIIGYLIVGLAFWFMDANYLRLEKQFRMHHQAIVSGSIPYLEQYRFNPAKYQYSIFKVMFNSFSIIIYPILLISVSLILYSIR